MLQLPFIRENKELVAQSLKTRNFPHDQVNILDQIIELDDQRKSTQKQLDDQRALLNSSSEEIGELFKKGEKELANNLREKVKLIKEQITALEEKAEQIKSKLQELLYNIPNVVHPDVPPGKGDQDNEVYQDWDKPLPELAEEAQAHWDLAKKYKLIDFELGAKISGSGFPLFRGKGAKLQRALINFFLHEAQEAGFEEIIP
ncbi:MAG TPA: serine--tRNA ligase, partial [Phaeodactylibacter sp.]|nr:serine--tRNA ligase [Phaeodactylibacter sp.]